MHLPDINVWLALAFEVHAHYRSAAEWFDTLEPRSCAFCRFTQQGFLRLATNPVVLKDDAVTMVEAWKCYDALLSDDRIVFLQEPSGLEQNWRRHTRKRKYSHRVWSDAYLVSFAESAGLTNVTFDRGFRDYDDVRPLVLGE
jgi:uncharacterized protein